MLIELSYFYRNSTLVQQIERAFVIHILRRLGVHHKCTKSKRESSDILRFQFVSGYFSSMKYTSPPSLIIMKWIQAPSYSTGCLARMEGFSGDPILFAKRVGRGTIEAKQLPTLTDYQTLADFQSIADLSRIQNRVIQSGRPDMRNQCLIGIYNSASRLNKSSDFELFIEELGDHPQCPSQCSFHGRCILTPYSYYCQCDPGLLVFW